jgi:hypothetical protein
MMRSSRHEPSAELERHALRIELPFGEPYRRLTRLPGVRWHATEHPLGLLHAHYDDGRALHQSGT